MKNKILEILIVEDNPKHLADAEAEIQRVKSAEIPINATYARTYEEDRELMQTSNYDGVISDIFFPAEGRTPTIFGLLKNFIEAPENYDEYKIKIDKIIESFNGQEGAKKIAIERERTEEQIQREQEKLVDFPDASDEYKQIKLVFIEARKQYLAHADEQLKNLMVRERMAEDVFDCFAHMPQQEHAALY